MPATIPRAVRSNPPGIGTAETAETPSPARHPIKHIASSRKVRMTWTLADSLAGTAASMDQKASSAPARSAAPRIGANAAGPASASEAPSEMATAPTAGTTKAGQASAIASTSATSPASSIPTSSEMGALAGLTTVSASAELRQIRAKAAGIRRPSGGRIAGTP